MLRARGLALDADEGAKTTAARIVKINGNRRDSMRAYHASVKLGLIRPDPDIVHEITMMTDPPEKSDANGWGQSPKQARIARRENREQRRGGKFYYL